MALSLIYRYIGFNGSSITYNNFDGYDIGFGSTGNNNLIRVGTPQDRTYLIDVFSSKFYRNINNIQKTDFSKAIIYNDTVKDLESPLTEIPNWCAVLNINFGDPSGVTNYNVTSAKLTASGVGNKIQTVSSDSVNIHVAEICNTGINFNGVGSGSANWATLSNKLNAFLELSKNPGPSGINGNISSSGSPQKIHDWHIAISVEPKYPSNAPYMSISCIIEYI